MISRNLSKRVQKLETRLAPTDESMVIQMIYVSPTEALRTDRGSQLGAHQKTPISAPPYTPSFRRDAMTARFPRGAACAAHLREQSSWTNRREGDIISA